MPKRRSTKLDPVQRARRVEIGEERRAKTRELLLAAAYRLFAAHGSDAPTIDDVIAEAKVARGTFYNHFTTRDDLFKAVADDIALSINAMIKPAIANVSDPAVQVGLSYRMFVHFAVSDAARGWILLRTMPLVGLLNAEMRTITVAQFSEAYAQGRFTTASIPIAMDLGLGSLIMTINRALREGVSDEYIDEAAETFLSAVGLSKKEAHRIAHLPLDFDALPALAFSSNGAVSARRRAAAEGAPASDGRAGDGGRPSSSSVATRPRVPARRKAAP
jgi:AcrR family transcriptional regulator